MVSYKRNRKFIDEY